jgi:glycosyltransferase involved in cell wall biosynthesis
VREPTVGVAIAVRNGERWLAACLDSLLAQTLPATEIVVVDDGSHDATPTIAARYAPLVRLRRIPRSGIGAARNLSFGLVQAELIVSVDADDLLTPFSVEVRVAALRSKPELELVFGHERRFSEVRAGQPVPLGEPRPAPMPGAMLLRRNSFARVGPFTDGRVTDGLDWLLRSREAGLLEHTVSEHVTWRRVHGANNSLTQREALCEFPRALKASLDRRRGLTTAAPEEELAVQASGPGRCDSGGSGQVRPTASAAPVGAGRIEVAL